ncbi:universal stress protein [Actinoplanes oblitus]|uniref:Universal stress protein n=1 Tax=Actinoplanes oblitus TaxID=3040509 RepID=A0ABY8WSG0_9ACTN|nr:universal stress protein [Actinoplanes oblitus]WIN00569.1 universal stress protein [Actinoplanes oblitus]
MNTVEPVLVGTDGSAPAQAAVRWAAVEAQRRNAALTVLSVYDPTWAAAPGPPRRDLTEAAEEAEAVVAEARTAIGTLAPSLTVHTVVAPGDPAAVLLEHGRDAGLLVVGHRGRGGFTSLMLGSVGSRVSTHARCPTVVVRGRALAIDGPVVVGVDGSPGSDLAISAAFEAARRRHGPVLAVHAYATPLPPVGPGLAPIAPPDPEQIAKSHVTAVDEILAGWIDRFPDVPVQVQVATGTAAGLLVGASHHAQLVVVGSRGLGTVAGTLLGSVGQQLLHHADCPILIARQ